MWMAIILTSDSNHRRWTADERREDLSTAIIIIIHRIDNHHYPRCNYSIITAGPVLSKKQLLTFM